MTPMDLQDFWSALWAIVVALAVCSLAIATVYAWWPELGELFGKQRPVKIRIRYERRSPDGTGKPQSAGAAVGEAGRLPDEAQAVHVGYPIGALRAEVKSALAGSTPADAHSFSKPAVKGFSRANAHKLAAALDDIGGTRLVSSKNVVPGPWRIQ